jgi:hypothetical protein
MRLEPLADELEHFLVGGVEAKVLQYFVEANARPCSPWKREYSLGGGLFPGWWYDYGVAVGEFLMQTGMEVSEAGNDPVPLDAAPEWTALELSAGILPGFEPIFGRSGQIAYRQSSSGLFAQRGKVLEHGLVSERFEMGFERFQEWAVPGWRPVEQP